MLPPFIIEQIRKREEEEDGTHEVPVLELPLPLHEPSSEPRRRNEDDTDRGVVIIDLMG